MPLREQLRNTTMLAGIVSVCWASSEAAAADMSVLSRSSVGAPPAVDGLNGKVDGLLGSLDQRSLYAARGSLTMPLTQQWGLQIDGAGGSLGHKDFGSIAGHLFTRNPLQGLLGVYASYTNWDMFGGVHASQVAAEAEAYWGRWTFGGIAGVEFGSSASNVTPTAFGNIVQSIDVKTRFTDQINLKYYLNDNWDGYIGHRYVGGKNALALGTEVGLPLGRGQMGTAFVEGRVGSTSFEGVWGGVRVYFGQKDKTLIRRHREDDPGPFDVLGAVANNYHTSTQDVFSTKVPPIP
jgi:hypothetical protein